MTLNDYFWYFSSAVPIHICNEIIKYAQHHESKVAITGKQTKLRNPQDPLDKEEIKILRQKRKSKIVWMDDRWIYKEIHPYLMGANHSAGWNFEWSWSEACQFTSYTATGHYGWHQDSWDKPYDDPKRPAYRGKIRKLSMTLNLSDPATYTGGELEFDPRNHDPQEEKARILKCPQIKPQGSIVIFPSFLWHRIRPIRSGKRYSLVCWSLGWPFK